eukprot:TRINITY_DN1407_c0_g1_i3.p1 TRINITY_DN1407_c0_g1~~TRINITY_DN1407_c0_g1_i3.p1  ORF type:complete len:267 (-),score=57.53 TRINITY_DN1407_c0_g1_i3:1098-1898(-)
MPMRECSADRSAEPGLTWLHRSAVGQKYVGLANQGATCYLNSLLQTLFMTHEFRSVLYQAESIFQPGSQELRDDTKNVALQLQKLFVQMQTTNPAELRAVSTEALTRSFGWDHGERFEQHDVQELFKLLFDCLEERFRATEFKDIIKELYEGTVQDFVICSECRSESVRPDKFQDISLNVADAATIDEALIAFKTPEVCAGDSSNTIADAHSHTRTHTPTRTRTHTHTRAPTHAPRHTRAPKHAHAPKTSHTLPRSTCVASQTCPT